MQGFKCASGFVGIAMISVLAGTASAQQCAETAAWETLRNGGDEPMGVVLALEVFDAGSGPMLYAAGSLLSAGPVGTANIARWNGSAWEALPGGNTGSLVLSLETWDDGAGEALFAGGWFTTAGASPVDYIARYDGTGWAALGDGLDVTGFGQPEVSALAVYDGSLIAAGVFDTAGGSPAMRTASWDGSAWSALGASAPLDDQPFTLYSDAVSGDLFVGGVFTQPAAYVARLDGGGWGSVGSSPANAPDDAVWAINRLPGGGLVVGGDLSGGVSVFNEGANAWETLGGGTNGPVRALLVFDDGSGEALFAGGAFTQAGGVPANGIAKWNGSSWEALGGGLTGMPGTLPPTVFAMAALDAGEGDAVTVSGSFDMAGAEEGTVARWIPQCAEQESCIADINTKNVNPGEPGYGSPDGEVDGADLSYYVENWLGQNAAVADINTKNVNPGDPGYGSPDGEVDGADLSFFVENWIGTLGICSI